jgi:hypothetical protein
MSDRARFPATVALGLLAAACASKPVPTLTPVGDVIPAGISFEGRWRINEEGPTGATQTQRTMTGGLSGIDAPDQATRRKKKSRRSKDESSVHVFLETGRDLKITQTADGLFVSFDRSVVEEYRFREHRQINVGPIEADRASGWEYGRYVVNTLDRQGALLTETWSLADSNRQLMRTISIVYGDEELLNLLQVFDRVE